MKPRHLAASLSLARSLAVAMVGCAVVAAQAQTTSEPVQGRPMSRPVATTAGSLDGNASAPAHRLSPKSCAALRRQYLQSQVCFDRYRLANGGLRAAAATHCRNVVDPSPRCGPDLPTK